MHWTTSKREIPLDRPLVMGILNVTPDSFSDGGKFDSVERAVEHAAHMIAEGADVIDVGGESTRPGSVRISVEEEIARVVPVIKAINQDFDIPLSIDTSKSEVAEAAVEAGAEIINDISGLRFDGRIAEVAVAAKAGLVLMHSRGNFETMHSQPRVDNILHDVIHGLRRSIGMAEDGGVKGSQIALDIGIGFGKTLEQNLEMIANLDQILAEFPDRPLIVGASRKSFIGKLLDRPDAADRLSGSVVAAAVAIWNGANIMRVHDVRETVEVLKLTGRMRELAVRNHPASTPKIS